MISDIEGVRHMEQVQFGGSIRETGIACRLRDGVTLYADVYRPIDPPGACPVLLMRQPYGKALASTVTQAHPIWYARQGFIVVVQDVRGRGESGGVFDPFIHEADDGYDAVEWAARLPGSNGKVGMYGFSYQGITQWAAASAAPPALKAIAPGMCGADVYNGMIYPQGKFAVAELVPWGFQLARDEARRRGGDDEAEAWTTRVRRNTPDELLYPLPEKGSHPFLREYFPSYGEWYAHGEYDAYWQARSWSAACLDNDLPIFLVGGWYDTFLMGTLLDYEAFREKRGRDGTLQLTIGPWDHIPWGRYAGGRDHGAEANGDIHVRQAKWFKRWLADEADVQDGAVAARSTEPAVAFYERGSGAWRIAEEVKPFGGPFVERKRLWLGGSERPANGAMGGGKLTDERPGEDVEAVADAFVYDARMPMYLSGFQPSMRQAQQDRYEILVYTGVQLRQPLRMFGAPVVEARCQVIGGPTDLAAVLSIVKPDGTAEFLTAGIATLGEEANADGAGKWTAVRVELRPIAAELQAGEAIRLELTGSGYPLYHLHPNGVGEERIHAAKPSELNMATVAVGYRGENDSWLDLPLI